MPNARSLRKKRIVIEIDGVQHEQSQNKTADEKRDFDLMRLGLTVLRYKNKDINDNFHTVCEDILKHLGLKAGDVLLKGGTFL